MEERTSEEIKTLITTNQEEFEKCEEKLYDQIQALHDKHKKEKIELNKQLQRAHDTECILFCRQSKLPMHSCFINVCEFFDLHKQKLMPLLTSLSPVGKDFHKKFIHKKRWPNRRSFIKSEVLTLSKRKPVMQLTWAPPVESLLKLSNQELNNHRLERIEYSETPQQHELIGITFVFSND